MRTIDRRQHWVTKYKKAKGCEKCGYNTHPRALCFDHIDTTNKNSMTKNGKYAGGGGMWRLYAKKYPVKIPVDEMRKCRVLCMNCHMEETYK